jgi:hypothetical protein
MADREQTSEQTRPEQTVTLTVLKEDGSEDSVTCTKSQLLDGLGLHKEMVDRGVYKPTKRLVDGGSFTSVSRAAPVGAPLDTAASTMTHHLCIFGVPKEQQITDSQMEIAKKQVQAGQKQRLVAKLAKENPNSLVEVEFKPKIDPKPKVDLNAMD